MMRGFDYPDNYPGCQAIPSAVPQEVVKVILNYKQAKEHMRIRLASAKTHKGFLERIDPPRIRIPGTDLVQTFFVEIIPDASHLTVTPILLRQWGATTADLIMASAKVETARGYTVEQLDDFAGREAFIPKAGTLPTDASGKPLMYTVISERGTDCGAYGVFLPEIRKKLLGLFADGYYLLLPNTDYPLIIPYNASISVKDLQKFANGFFNHCDIRTSLSPLVYFTDSAGKLSTLSQGKEQKK